MFLLLLKKNFDVPHSTNIFFLFIYLMNQNWLGAVINPGMALTAFLSSIGWDLNPRPSNRESSLLTTRPDYRHMLFEAVFIPSQSFWLNLNKIFSYNNI